MAGRNEASREGEPGDGQVPSEINVLSGAATYLSSKRRSTVLIVVYGRR